jgi:tetratricopeptide (TPR) repeat protein
MSKRWFINAFLVVALVSFLGLSIAPLLDTAFRREQPGVASSPNVPGLPQDQQSILEEQAKGYELVLQREPDNETALQGLLEIRLQLGDIEQAIVPLEKLAALNPDQLDYAMYLAEARFYLGDREAAAATYRSVLEKYPGNLDALQGLTNLLLDQQRPEAALGLLQESLELAEQINPEQAEGSPEIIDVFSIQLIVGQVYVELERYDEAIELYDQLSLSNTQDFRPPLAKATVLFQNLGESEKAAPFFEQAAELAPPQYRDQIKQLAAQSAIPVPQVPDVLPTIEADPEGSDLPNVEGEPALP